MKNLKFFNKLVMMVKLNNLIITFNNNVLQSQKELYEKMLGDDWNVVRDESLAPSFHTYGIRKRKITKGGKISSKKSHRWSWWRETQAHAKRAEEDGIEIPAQAKADTLHLADKHRGTMGKAVHNYFTNMFSPMF